jgi:hypothetical protein
MYRASGVPTPMIRSHDLAAVGAMVLKPTIRYQAVDFAPAETTR